MFKKHMTALTKGGQMVSNAGKGSQQAPLPQRGTLNSLANPNTSINNYAKASPISQPAGVPDVSSLGGGGADLGS